MYRITFLERDLDHAPRYAEGLAALPERVRTGMVRILDGIEHAPGSIAGLYRGENPGKRRPPGNPPR